MDQEMQALLKSVADTQARQTDLMEQLAKNGDAQKTVGTVQSAGWLHGSLGIFSPHGLEREVISTHVRPYGLGSNLPKLPSVFEDPRYGALTGVSTTSLSRRGRRSGRRAISPSLSRITRRWGLRSSRRRL